MKHERPLIGVTADLNLAETVMSLDMPFMDALTRLGAMPVLLPVTSDERLLASYVHELDGFLFSGGSDVDPMMYSQEQKPSCGGITPQRDRCELPLARLLAERTDKPVLGICRGFQVINIALGGDVYQDLPTEFEGNGLVAHEQKQAEKYPSHRVSVTRGSLLHRIVGTDSMLVNSVHHQAVHRQGAGFVVSANAPDGVIEAAELEGHTFFLGVQWHPEEMWRRDSASAKLFQAFIDACAAA